jgi:hypothetical protein
MYTEVSLSPQSTHPAENFLGHFSPARPSADISPNQVHRGCESERNLLRTQLFSDP